MSWTSHAYHVAKDFQVLAAASLTFAAAGLAFLAQNRVADKNAKSALAVLERQQRKSQQDDEREVHRYRTAFLIAIADTATMAEVDLHRLRLVLSRVKSKVEVDQSTGRMTIDAEGLEWTYLVSQPSIRDSHSIFSTTFDELARLEPATQTQFRTMLLFVQSVDRYHRNIIHFQEKNRHISVDQIDNVIDLVDKAIETLTNIEEQSRAMAGQ